MSMSLYEYLDEYGKEGNWGHLLDIKPGVLEGKMVKTSDDWEPSFPGGYVLLKVHDAYLHVGQPYMMTASGFDDFSLSIDYGFKEEDKGRMLRAYITIKEPLSIKDYGLMGGE